MRNSLKRAHPKFPPRVFAGWLMRRTLFIWLCIRAVFLAILSLFTMANGSVLPAAPFTAFRQHMFLALLSVSLSYLEAHRRNELLLLANLGVSRVAAVATMGLLPVSAELVLFGLR